MNRTLSQVQNWIELAQKAGWCVTRMAKNCGVSVRGLQRYFHQKMGQSPKAWLIQRRQEWAKDLLENGCSVKETAIFLGYRYAHNLSREFKKFWGSSPSESIKRDEPVAF